MKNLFREIIAFLGISSSFYGIHQMHEPTAFIVVGVFLVWLASGKGGK